MKINEEKLDRSIEWKKQAHMKDPIIGILMGSASDLPVMEQAEGMLQELGLACELTIASAHRAPDVMMDWVRQAEGRGIRVIIAGAGGAAHLPGMIAALTVLPVIGVPIKSTLSLDGWDSILSILQMPSGIPVATVALNNAKNAAILAAQMLGTGDEQIREKLREYKDRLREGVINAARDLEQKRRPVS